VDEPIDSTKCGSKRNCHKNNEPCLTHDLWMGLSEQIRNYLEKISLAEVLARKPVAELTQKQQHTIQVLPYSSVSQ
jgi:Rrf2 family iron-sulfur cluster assembly transcriptional regulator